MHMFRCTAPVAAGTHILLRVQATASKIATDYVNYAGMCGGVCARARAFVFGKKSNHDDMTRFCIHQQQHISPQTHASHTQTRSHAQYMRVTYVCNIIVVIFTKLLQRSYNHKHFTTTNISRW